jgi:O-antigen/teichoic acid export membrane protein
MWVGSSRLTLQGLQFVTSLATARLLTPTEFGTAAITLAIANFAYIFTELGLGPAVVQAEAPDDEFLTTAFWLNVLSGVGLTALCSAVAWPLAALYGMDDLAPLIVLASFTFTLACAVVPLALLERGMEFRRIALIELRCYAAGIVLVPLAALSGLGAASIVLGNLVTAALLTIATWRAVEWRPRGRPARAAVGQLWRFSRGLVGYSSMNYWSRNLDLILLGRAVSTAQVGNYARAYTLTRMPVQQMNLVVGRVLLPPLSRLQREPRRMGEAWLRGTSEAGALVACGAATQIATAPALIEVLYGHRWADTAPILQLLALGAFPQIVGASSGTLYRASGKTGMLFRIGLINTLLTVTAMLIGLRWGAHGVAVALSIESWLILPLIIGPLLRSLGLGLRTTLRPLGAMLLPAIAVAAAEIVARLAAPEAWPTWAVLLAQLVGGAAAALAALAWRRPDLLQRGLTRLGKLLPSHREEPRA